MSQSQTPEPGTERILRSTTRNTVNPRRRPRQSDNDGTNSIKPPKRRRRNEVKDDTFRPRDSTENQPPAESESVAEDEGNINVGSMNGHLRHASSHHRHHDSHDSTTMRNGFGSQRDAPMTIRSKPKRLRGDGATTLTQTSCYNVKMLPSTPKELRREGVEYRGSMSSSGHALAVTHQKAIIWDYNAHITATNPRTFDMPFVSKPGAPLPFGALVSNGPVSSDLGLVLISATSGKVVFYDSIERAASLGLFQDRNTGVEGSVGSLFSGETVADLVSADHAGFVVMLSSGRIAQLTLRDAQGKPKISSQIMRVTEVSNTLLGSFGRLWSGGFRKDLTAVHTRPLNVRGQMQAIGLTERAEVLIWDMDWSGRTEFKSSIEFWEVLITELRDLQLPEMEGKVHNTTALDFAILDKPSLVVGNEVATVGTEQPLALMLLLRIGDIGMHSYALAEVTVYGDNVGVARMIQLSTYRSNGDIGNQRKPRLIVPKPGHTAFVVFEDATLMVSTKETESPDAQFHQQEASILESQPELYEETIHLRSNMGFAIQNAWDETPRGNASYVVAFVKGAGMVRISATDVNTVEDALPGGVKLSPKTKIEQAVFYGALQPDNIIDFSRRTESKFQDQEIEEAALEVSQEIFRAETSFTHIISPSPTSMEQHLALKAKALKALAAFVRQNYPVLSRSAMWKLLWDAERVAAGRQLWIAFEEHVAMSMDNGKRKATLLDELCQWFVEGEKPWVGREDLKDEDPVRKFFIGGLHRLEKLMEYICAFLSDLQKDQNEQSPEIIMRLVYSANDVWIRSLETAFAFRSENCSDYGILPELINDGILIDAAEYVDVPEFWTSTDHTTSGTVAVANHSRHFATKYFDIDTMPTATANASDIAEWAPRLVTLYCLQAREGIQWRASRPSPNQQEHAHLLRQKLAENRYHLCRQLADMGQSEAGMRLAEKYQDMHTLTDMVIAEDQYCEEMQHKSDTDAGTKKEIAHARRDLQAKVRQYFDRFGTQWGDEFFDKLFSGPVIGDRLQQAQLHWREALGTYLRSHPSRAKICWINDVTTEDDYAHAGAVLAQSAEQQETRLWPKKVELSMSKLALLAADEAGGFGTAKKLTNGSAPTTASPAKDLVLVDIQEKLSQHFYQDTNSAIDHEAALDMIMKRYGKHTADHQALRHLLEQAVSQLLEHTALDLDRLIDILTLMDINDNGDDGNLQSSEFFNALVALDACASSLPPNRVDMLLQLIWKRCYIYDDWAKLQMSKKKSDEERREGLRTTMAWSTIHYCVRAGLDRILMPSECLGSACLPQDLVYRFPSEDLLDPILHDCKIQDEILQGFVADRHLDEIAQECLRDVKEAVKVEAEETAVVEEESEINGHANGHVQDGEEMVFD